MRFSIIIPVFNIQKYIAQCIRSVLTQTFNDFELIVIDDGSTDESGKICDTFSFEDSRITVIHQENAGLSVARNTGVNHAKGEYILFLDGDDYYCDCELLGRINDVANNNDLIVFGWKEVDEAGLDKNTFCNEHMSRVDEKYANGRLFLESALAVNHSYPWYVWIYAFRKKWWEENGFSFLDGKLYEDMDLTFRVITEAQGVDVLNNVAYAYRRNRVSAITYSVTMRSAEDHINIMIRNINYVLELQTISDVLRRLLLNNFSNDYYFIVRDLLTLDGDSEKELLLNRLKDTQWVCQYSIDLKYRLTALLIRTFGIKVTSFILNVRRFFRNRKKSRG